MPLETGNGAGEGGGPDRVYTIPFGKRQHIGLVAPKRMIFV